MLCAPGALANGSYYLLQLAVQYGRDDLVASTLPRSLPTAQQLEQADSSNAEAEKVMFKTVFEDCN